jgi:excisionase family DNA binding protein
VNKQIISPDDLRDFEGAAAYLLVTRRYLRAQCKAGWITHVKLNRTAYRFTKEGLNRYTRKSKGAERTA